jgi:hypothetical protein
MDPRLTRNFPASEDETMTMKTLPDVCHDQLQDLHSACAQSPDTAAKPGRAASIREPIEAPIAGAQGIGDGLHTRKSLCATQDISPTAEHCNL